MPSDQPFLHCDVVVLRAPLQVWSGTDGQIRTSGVQGVYRGDLRVLSQAIVRVDDVEPEPIGQALPDADHAVFTAAIRTPEATTPDLQLVLVRDRRLTGDALTETFTLRSALSQPVRVRIELELACDLATMSEVKSGSTPVAVAPGLGDHSTWGDGTTLVTVQAGTAEVASDGGSLTLGWSVIVPAGGSVDIDWALDTVDAEAALIAPRVRPIRAALAERIGRVDDDRWVSWLSRSAADLDALLLASADRPDDAFLAAGAPWYFTLFGRDSIWAARLLLPLCPELALSTAQVLADRQGIRSDPETAEQPGKILHELRDRPVQLEHSRQGEALSLPPVYYGSTDATLLWISLLAETWRAGADPAAIELLLPALQAALGWLHDHADADGDGFVEYVDAGGRGLSNQGWKDSNDAIRFADGGLAQGSIALVEVQGYAHRAALDGAELLDAFGLPGGKEWRRWAAELASRFRAAFWCRDALGRYPALALDDPNADGRKRQVDSVASNIGHLLGTGILNTEESATVAARLRHPSLASGYGIRTLSSDNGGYWPWSYHCGSVWAHDTAIIIDGLARDGHHEQAAELGVSLLAAAQSYDGRLPELFGGDGAFPARPPSAYPASCRPQAWAAAAVFPAARTAGIF